MATTCPICGQRLDPSRSRRPAKFCSSRCKQAAYRLRKMTQYPAEMRAATRWTFADEKRPTTATGKPASSTDTNTWTTYENVQNSPHGFMLGAGFGCIDLDNCLTDGKPTPWAKRIIAAAPGAWIERSISGHGLHIFGLLPEAKGQHLGTSVEIYSRARFIRTTCDVYQPGKLTSLCDAVARAGRITLP